MVTKVCPKCNTTVSFSNGSSEASSEKNTPVTNKSEIQIIDKVKTIPTGQWTFGFSTGALVFTIGAAFKTGLSDYCIKDKAPFISLCKNDGDNEFPISSGICLVCVATATVFATFILQHLLKKDEKEVRTKGTVSTNASYEITRKKKEKKDLPKKTNPPNPNTKLALTPTSNSATTPPSSNANESDNTSA